MHLLAESNAGVVLAIALACIAAFSAASAPIIAGRILSKQKEQDWAHQAELDAKAEARAKTTNDKLDVVHTLVDGNVTRLVQESLDSTEREVASLQEIIDLKRADGKEPTAGALAIIEAAEVKIAALQNELVERHKANGLVQVLEAVQETQAPEHPQP